MITPVLIFRDAAVCCRRAFIIYLLPMVCYATPYARCRSMLAARAHDAARREMIFARDAPRLRH